MRTIVRKTRFKKDFKKLLSSGKNMEKLAETLRFLQEGQQLPERYRDHALIGVHAGYRECHITPDWLLIYKIEKDVITLSLTRTGTHSDLF